MIVNGHPDYAVDDDGSVFNFRTEKYLKPCVGPGGYATVCLNGRNYLLHRLVAMHFVRGYKPKYTVNHKDLNKLNNNSSNLEWVTHRQNVRHAHQAGAYKIFMTSYSHRKHDVHNAISYPNCSECVIIISNETQDTKTTSVSQDHTRNSFAI